MTYDHFLFINRFKSGYGKVWPSGTRQLDNTVVDRLIPKLIESISDPGMAYSGTRLSEDSYVLAVGLRWPQLQDENGRPGLSFCHGILCRCEDADPIFEILSILLVSMVRRYSLMISDVGKIVQSLAIEPGSQPGGGARLEKLCLSIVSQLPSLDDSVFRLALGAKSKLASTDLPKNIRASFPLHEQSTIPSLVDYLISNRVGSRVGGGELLIATNEQYELISRSEDTTGYVSIGLSVELLYQMPSDRLPLVSANNNELDPVETSESRFYSLRNRYTSGLSAASLLLYCVSTFVVLWILSFKIDFIETLTNFFPLIGENGITFFILAPYIYIIYSFIVKIFFIKEPDRT